MQLVLASASPRRKELLSRITENFKVIVSEFDESTIFFKGKIEDYVMELAKGKALDVSLGLNKNQFVIGCDTVVALNGKVLGKPQNYEEAYSMLRNLSGKWHEVYSGIAIVDNTSNKILTDYVCTKVKFSDITDKEIKKYINTGEPMDKAGAYGIQGFGGLFVERIDGCFYNVVGLPLNRLVSMMRNMGINEF
ncbi:Maf-like protein [Haloimpatiens sp. FM7315]|uniref:Maf-like protein n=1 Tax=Haloimpatiens sp. FM7315 TaxID=3298609 RepID=UPI0035A388B3